MVKNKNKIVDYTDADYYNLKYINDSRWKWTLGFSTVIKRKLNGTQLQSDNDLHYHAGNEFKRIAKLEKTFTNIPVTGFIVMHNEENKFLHYHCIFFDLLCIDKIKTLYPTGLNGGYTDGEPMPYTEQKICHTDYIGYILRKEWKDSLYYSPQLLKEIKYERKAVPKVDKQTGLIDSRNAHLWHYLSDERKASHNNINNFEKLYERD